MKRDHYQVLQISRDADQVLVDKAYRVLSLKYHPDTSGESEEVSTRRMQRLNEAYAVLGDPVRRARYDAILPQEGSQRTGWDVFWEEGLVGLYLRRGGRG